MKDLSLVTTIKALPEDVYNALTNQRIIEIWTGEAAEMNLEKGAEFTWFEGDISGKIIDFEENKKLVQHWDFGDNPPSEVTIKLHTDKRGTRMEVHQKGIPEDDFENIKEGWEDVVFGGLKELLEE